MDDLRQCVVIEDSLGHERCGVRADEEAAPVGVSRRQAGAALKHFGADVDGPEAPAVAVALAVVLTGRRDRA